MFVSHFLDKLPPVGFGNMDASALLSRVEQLSSEVSALRRAIEAQVTVNKDLTAATVAVNRRVTALEGGQRSTPVLGLETAAGALWEREAQKQTGPGRQEVTADPSDAVAAESIQLRTPTLRSPPWSFVVRSGEKKPTPKMRQPRRNGAPPWVRREQRNTGIIGTGTESSISVITTKRASVFATKFAPDLDAVTLCLSEKLANPSVTCRKIESASRRFGSFHITDSKQTGALVCRLR